MVQPQSSERGFSEGIVLRVACQHVSNNQFIEALLFSDHALRFEIQPIRKQTETENLLSKPFENLT